MSKPKLDRETARTVAEMTRSLHRDSVRRIKTVRATVKSTPTDGSGTFVALVSTFGPPPDREGDIISPGAYDRTLADASVNHPGALWPVYWLHDIEEPESAIGLITRAVVTKEGLVVEGKLSLDNPKAMSVYERLLDGTVREFSIHYAIIADHGGTWKGKRVRYLDELELLEISVVPFGMNPYTRVLSVKGSRSLPDQVVSAVQRAGISDENLLTELHDETVRWQRYEGTDVEELRAQLLGILYSWAGPDEKHSSLHRYKDGVAEIRALRKKLDELEGRPWSRQLDRMRDDTLVKRVASERTPNADRFIAQIREERLAARQKAADTQPVTHEVAPRRSAEDERAREVEKHRFAAQQAEERLREAEAALVAEQERSRAFAAWKDTLRNDKLAGGFAYVESDGPLPETRETYRFSSTGEQVQRPAEKPIRVVELEPERFAISVPAQRLASPVEVITVRGRQPAPAPGQVAETFRAPVGAQPDREGAPLKEGEVVRMPTGGIQPDKKRRVEKE